jgi:hypothetical protein
MFDRCEVCSHASHAECYQEAVQRGAAVAFGLVGMAEAIRACDGRMGPSWECSRCDHRNRDMRAIWCERCSPKCHAREIREGYPEDGSRGRYKESES